MGLRSIWKVSVKSRCSIRGHPIHPLLVNFPIALFITALFFDLVYLWQRDPLWYKLSFYNLIIGYLGALAAVMAGAVDFFLVVPDDARVVRPAVIHALLGLTLLVPFGLSLWLQYPRGATESSSLSLAIALSVLGVVMLSLGAWYGGELVYRHRIGVPGAEEKDNAS